MTRNSLEFRLLASGAAWSVVVLVTTGLIISSLMREVVEANFDARLQAYLDGLIAHIELDSDGRLRAAGSIGDARFDQPLSGWYWQVAPVADGPAAALTSLSLLDQTLPLSGTEALPPGSPAMQRFYRRGPAGQNLRIVQQDIQLAGSDGLYTFTVGGNGDELEAQMAQFNNTLIVALTVMGLGVVGAGLIQIRFGLRPLRVFERSLSSIRSGRQSRLTGIYPEEVQQLADELNALLASNEQIVSRARTHVGNLAHALKTPLSVIANEAKAGSGPTAAKVAEQAAIMRDQINLYLERARMAARGRALGVVTEVRPVVEAIMRTLVRIHADRAIATAIICDRGICFHGEKQDLEEAVGNLLENAFKWTGSTVTVAVEAVPSAHAADDRLPQIRVRVEDDGPGIDDAQKREAIKRGSRLDETTPGSGLGLSIVAELAALYDGRLALSDSALGGLRVDLDLPGSKVAGQPQSSVRRAATEN